MALSKPEVLVVAGTDSSGGAGIVRDVETIAGMGLRSAVACTAVTAQTDRGVVAIERMPPRLVAEQMRAAFAGNRIGAVKIGMLAGAGIAEAVACVIERHAGIPVVLDPVLAASSGGRLTDAAGLDCLRRRLLPLAALVTPNWLELAALSDGAAARDEGEAMAQAARLRDAGALNVLVKGGHAPASRGTDILCRGDGTLIRFEGSELPGELRGTGCALSSAIAAALAKGADLPSAVAAGRDVVRALLAAGVASRRSGRPGQEVAGPGASDQGVPQLSR